MAPVVIGVAGGTGSGKSTLVRRIVEHLPGRVAVLPQDAYYLDRRDLPFEERARLNYDHPLAFDTPLLVRHLRRLRQGKPVDRPVYNFQLHLRDDRTVRVEPRDVIVVEGILVLAEEAIRKHLDIKIYVDTDADVRILRRLVRDIQRRGRTLESVINQYLETVKPMHEQFVEPSKRYADLIIPEGGFNRVALDVLLARIRAALSETGAAASPGDRGGEDVGDHGVLTLAGAARPTGRRQRRRRRRRSPATAPAAATSEMAPVEGLARPVERDDPAPPARGDRAVPGDREAAPGDGRPNGHR